MKGINVFTEEINKIAPSSNDDKRIQSIDLIDTYAYGISKDLVSDKEEIKCSNIIKPYKWYNIVQISPKFCVIHTGYW